MTKPLTKEIASLSTEAAAVRGYRATAKMFAHLERQRRLHIQPYGHGPRARKMVMMHLYPKEYVAFLGIVAIGMFLNGDKTKGELLALVSGKRDPDATKPKAKRK